MARWTSQAIRLSKQVVLGLIVLGFLWFLYSVTQRYIKSLLGPQTAPPKIDLNFAETDTVKWSPVSHAPPSNVESDRTVDAILSGTYGPTVVVFYAEWCMHCVNMKDAYEAAARESSIPFVRVDGSKAPVSMRKYGVTGYPTILGVANVGGLPRRFASMRTKEAFLEFANALNPSAPTLPPGTVNLAPTLVAENTVAVDVAANSLPVGPNGSGQLEVNVSDTAQVVASAEITIVPPAVQISS